jgi:hypothetical protein
MILDPEYVPVPDIQTTEHGWVWVTPDGERHELNGMLKTHVRTKRILVGGRTDG